MEFLRGIINHSGKQNVLGITPPKIIDVAYKMPRNEREAYLSTHMGRFEQMASSSDSPSRRDMGREGLHKLGGDIAELELIGVDGSPVNIKLLGLAFNSRTRELGRGLRQGGKDRYSQDQIKDLEAQIDWASQEVSGIRRRGIILAKRDLFGVKAEAEISHDQVPVTAHESIVFRAGSTVPEKNGFFAGLKRRIKPLIQFPPIPARAGS